MTDRKQDKIRPELVPFEDVLIQQGRRIAISKKLLQNVGLQEGDAIELFYDAGDTPGEKAIVIKKSKDPGKVKPRGRRRTRQSTEQTALRLVSS